MELQLEDNVVLVAGSTRGIGLAVAESLLSEGARVVITGRGASQLKKIQDQLAARYSPERFLAIRADLSQKSAIKKTVQTIYSKWKKIDCLVANIGSGSSKKGWDLQESDWTESFDVNLWSSIRLVETVLKDMVKRRSGNVVLISSITGLEALGAPLTYSAAKAALLSYGKNLSRLVGEHGVRVNCVAPGNILFEGGSWERIIERNPKGVKQYIEREVPLKRFGTPEEIAGVVSFLASERAAFVTGACVVADGGQTRGV